MHAPQIIMIALIVFGLSVSMEAIGHSHTLNRKALVALLATVVITALLWWGGFWN